MAHFTLYVYLTLVNMGLSVVNVPPRYYMYLSHGAAVKLLLHGAEVRFLASKPKPFEDHEAEAEAEAR